MNHALPRAKYSGVHLYSMERRTVPNNEPSIYHPVVW